MQSIRLILLEIFFLSLLFCNSGTTESAHKKSPPPRTYTQVCQNINQTRLRLKDEYEHAQTDSVKNEILNRAKNVFFHAVYDSLIPFWYGTEWGFYGMTEIPGQGQIACGYFVTTILRDVGLKIDRVQLAKWPSERMIKSLTVEKFIRRFSNKSIEQFVAAVRKWSHGIYIVGLDCHTRFIINDGKHVRFVHSSYMEPLQVIKEKAIKSPILSASQYRVIGNLSADRAVIEKWLLGKSF